MAKEKYINLDGLKSFKENLDNNIILETNIFNNISNFSVLTITETSSCIFEDTTNYNIVTVIFPQIDITDEMLYMVKLELLIDGITKEVFQKVKLSDFVVKSDGIYCSIDATETGVGNYLSSDTSKINDFISNNITGVLFTCKLFENTDNTNFIVNGVNNDINSKDFVTVNGNDNQINGGYSFVSGKDNKINSDKASALGIGNIVSSEGGIASGTYCVENEEALVSVGNGVDDTLRSNALTLLKNGELTVAGDLKYNGDTSVSSIADRVTALEENPLTELPIASKTVLGGVKVDGSTITATVDGTISATSNIKEITQAEYDALNEEEKNNGTAYFISDAISDETSIIDDISVSTFSTYSSSKIETDYAKKTDMPEMPTMISELTNDSGYLTEADISDKAPIDSPAFLNSVSMGRRADTTIGANSTANGNDITACGENSHAEGIHTTACGLGSHAEGGGRFSALDTLKMFGGGTDYSELTTDEILDYYMCSSQSPGFPLASGECSHIEGFDCLAAGDYSHAEGKQSIALGNVSHSESMSYTKGSLAHSEGFTLAWGRCSHSEGGGSELPSILNLNTLTEEEFIEKWKEYYNFSCSYGDNSHIENKNCLSFGDNSHAEGISTIALTNQHAQGHYNNDTTATANSESGTSTGTAFVIGNGTSSSVSNAFRVTGEGVVYGGNYNSSGADYTEFEEWADGNPDNEDRVGYFVTYDENSTKKIRKANTGDWILGVSSGTPCIIGNADEDWMGRYITDEFGRRIEETFEYEVEKVTGYAEDGTPIIETVTKTGTKWKENPNYDSSKEYIQRADRPEWSTIGWMGVIHVRDDGTCEANGFCKCADGGIATTADPSEGSYLHPIYKVVDRVSENVIRAVIRF